MSHTYPVPGSEREYPAPRYPGLRVRVVPNESTVDLWDHLGELVQELVEVGRDYGPSIELDTSDRTLPGEGRGGASPLPVVALVLLQGVVDSVVGELLRVSVGWVKRHAKRRDLDDDGVKVVIYGPAGEVLREVRVRGD